MNRYPILTAIFLVFLATFATGCTGRGRAADQPPVSALTAQEAITLAEEAMAGLASGDFAVWSRNWSTTMKEAISEEAFLAYREELLSTMGAYQSIESVSLAQANTAGYVRWVAVTNFEKGQMEFAFSFEQDGRLIEGVFPRRIG